MEAVFCFSIKRDLLQPRFSDDDETPQDHEGPFTYKKRLCNIRCAQSKALRLHNNKCTHCACLLRIRASDWRQIRHLMSLSNSTSHKFYQIDENLMNTRYIFSLKFQNLYF